MKLKNLVNLSAVVAVVVVCLAVVAHAENFQTRIVHQEVSTAKMVGHLPSTQVLQFNVMLPLSNFEGAAAFAAAVSNPKSPSYRKFLTPAKFVELYGPSQQDYTATVRYLQTYGLKVVGGSYQSMLIQVQGPVSAIEKVFNVQVLNYQDPKTKQIFYSLNQEPTTTLPFSLWAIDGLDNLAPPKSMLSHYAEAHGLPTGTANPAAITGSGPHHSFLGSDMRAAYYGGSEWTGAGQNMAVLEFYGTNLQDVKTYYHNVGQTNTVPITVYSTDGTPTACIYTRYDHWCDDTEQTLDMTQALGMAPGLNSLTMYVGSSPLALLSSLANPPGNLPLALTIGSSWTWYPADPTDAEPYFIEMTSDGQSFYQASGDSAGWGDYSPYTYPSDDPYVTSVGGTALATTGAGGAWSSETAWVYSGGGYSPDGLLIPDYQSAPGGDPTLEQYVVNSNNGGSATYRNGPDVSANANWSFYVCASLSPCTMNDYGGTSFAAPMWAAYIALLNQAFASCDGGSTTQLNYAIYSNNARALANEYSWYADTFHDISSGGYSFNAVSGFDLVTGWGSPTTGFIPFYYSISCYS